MEEEIYTSQKKRLEEAIEAILQEIDDDECSLAIIPPDPSCLADEREGADDDVAGC